MLRGFSRKFGYSDYPPCLNIFSSSSSAFPVSVLKRFIKDEHERLLLLRDMLSGSVAPYNIESLLDECDYLFAHFPECAGTEGRRPPSTDTAFLKRVRAEIEGFLAIF